MEVNFLYMKRKLRKGGERGGREEGNGGKEGIIREYRRK
jgi:hypothetical protein